MSGILDPLRDLWNSLVKTDENKATIDNDVSKLHHRVSYFLLFFGVVASLASSFLFCSQIVCLDAPEYKQNFCLVHGAQQVELENITAGGTPCWDKKTDTGSTQSYTDFKEKAYNGRRPTDYYIWLPYALVVCMGLSKLSRMLWKMMEGGVMSEFKKENASTAETFIKMKEKKTLGIDSISIYFFKHFLMEVLNIIFLVVSIAVVNSLLHRQFLNYWPDISSFPYGESSDDLRRANGKGEPKCRLFPTEVNCQVNTGGVGGGKDTDSFICSLPANLFNQYFFIILWFWWTILLTVSLINIVYRMLTYIIPSFGRTVLTARLGLRGIFYDKGISGLCASDYFFLGRVADNMKRDEFIKVLRNLGQGDESEANEQKPLMKDPENNTQLVLV